MHDHLALTQICYSLLIVVGEQLQPAVADRCSRSINGWMNKQQQIDRQTSSGDVKTSMC
jgi:hypothetical protein